MATASKLIEEASRATALQGIASCWLLVSFLFWLFSIVDFVSRAKYAIIDK